jgi:hypothetical protein
MPILFSNVRTAPFVDYSSGGMPFVAQAPAPGFALVGLMLRVGAWVDQVVPLFSEMLEDGTLGPAVHGQAFGGHGGLVTQIHCAPGHVVTGLQTRSGSYVDAVRLYQTRWDGSLITSESAWTSWVGGPGGVERIARISEPEGASIAIGLAGRTGAYLENLTIVTAEPMRIAAQPIAKATGRTSKSATA